VYADELSRVFCEFAHISIDDLRTEQWGARLGLILNQVGYPLATLGKVGARKASRVPVREWVTKLRKRLETDVEERALIANLKTALAERVNEIQTARETLRHRTRSAAARKRPAGRKKAAEAVSTHNEVAL
jgi:hypothetical protein